MVSKHRLVILTAGVIALAFSLACSSDDTKNSQSVPAGNAQGVATVVVPAANTPELRPAQTPTPTAPPSETPRPPSTPPAGTTPSASGSTVTVAFPFQNALQARASLLGNARFGATMDQFDKNDPVDLRAYPGWASAYPTLRLVGSSVNSTPQTVSVYRNLLKDKEAGSGNNPKVIVFTVMDDKGACAAGVIRGFPTYDDYVTIDIGTNPCNASAAVAVLRR